MLRVTGLEKEILELAGYCARASKPSEKALYKCMKRPFSPPSPPPPSLPPVNTATCETVGSLLWCGHAEDLPGKSCTQVCNSCGLSPYSSEEDQATWFEAQDSEEECQTIATAFGYDFIDFRDSLFGCTQSSGVSLICSNFEQCPQSALTRAEGGPDGTFLHYCPCK